MKKQKYFLWLMIAIGCAFLLTCASIIFCVLNNSKVSDEQTIEHTLGFVYLFIHLIIVAVAFYLAFKAYAIRPGIINVIMTKEDKTLNKKSVRNAIIFASIFGVIFVYFVLLCSGLDIFLSFFSLGAKFAILNASFFVTLIATFLIFYKPY